MKKKMMLTATCSKATARYRWGKCEEDVDEVDEEEYDRHL